MPDGWVRGCVWGAMMRLIERGWDVPDEIELGGLAIVVTDAQGNHRDYYDFEREVENAYQAGGRSTDNNTIADQWETMFGHRWRKVDMLAPPS